jgi:hypothetical protein
MLIPFFQLNTDEITVTQLNNPHSRPKTYVAGIFKHSIASNQDQINQRVSFLTTIKTRLNSTASLTN